MASLKLKGRYYRIYPLDKVGYVEEELEFDTNETAFLLVDVYGTGFSEGELPVIYKGKERPTMIAPTAAEREKDIIINHIRPAKDAAKKIGLPIIYLANSAPRIALSKSVWYQQMKKIQDIDIEEAFKEDCVDPKEYMYGDSNQLKYSKIIAPEEGDYFIRKHFYSGFYETRLEGLLKNLGIKNLIAVGFAADICLFCTLIDALYRNYRVLLLRDCTLAVEFLDTEKDWGNTKWAIRWLETYVGNSTTSEEFIRACNQLMRQKT
jgi:ureidoacrylate peracid hydrolase